MCFAKLNNYKTWQRIKSISNQFLAEVFLHIMKSNSFVLHENEYKKCLQEKQTD